MGITELEKIWGNNDWEFPNNTKQDKCQKVKQKSTPRHSKFTLHNIKDKEKILKEAKGKKTTLSIEEQRLALHLTSQKSCKPEKSGVKYLTMSTEEKNTTNLQFCPPTNAEKKFLYHFKDKEKNKDLTQIKIEICCQ